MARSLSLVVVLAVVGCAGLVAFRVGQRARPVPAVPVVVDDEEVGPVGALTVHVAGEVLRPGLVEVPKGARVADAIAAAGGATPAADLAAVNLAEEVVDGSRLVVPGPGGAAGSSGPGDGVVHLNGASAEELVDLPGIGPVLAQRIVEHRERVGPFEEVEDLLGVSGIGERLLAGLADLVAP